MTTLDLIFTYFVIGAVCYMAGFLSGYYTQRIKKADKENARGWNQKISDETQKQYLRKELKKREDYYQSLIESLSSCMQTSIADARTGLVNLKEMDNILESAKEHENIN